MATGPHPTMATPGPSRSGAPPLASLDVALLVALSFLWGSAYIFIRVGLVAGAPPLVFAAVRYLISALIFAAIAAAAREPFPAPRAALASAALGGTFLIGLYGGLLYSGEQFTTGGYASVLSESAPILTVVFAYAVLPNERLTARSLVGIGVGFAGTVVLVAPELFGGSVGSWPGPLLILGAFLCTAVGSVLLRRYGGGRQGLWQLGIQFSVGTLVLLLAIRILGSPRSLPATNVVYGALAALVIFSSIMGYFVYFTLLHRVGPIRANAVAYLLPLVGVGLGSGLYGEPVTLWEVAGFLIVIAGITLVLQSSARAPPPSPAPR